MPNRAKDKHAAPSTARPCKATTKQGKPCAGRCLPDRDYCLFHDPARATERAADRRKGGKARHGRRIDQVNAERPAVKIESVADVLAVVTGAINDTLALENSNQRNRTLGTLAMAALKAFEISELEQRLLALEALVKDKAA